MDRKLPPVIIRRARPADIDALVGLEEAVFPTDRMSRRSFQRSVDAPTITMLTAVSERRPVGYALVHRRRGSKVARLASIAVAADAAGAGIGEKLLRKAEAEARRHGAASMRLEARADNTAARRLYDRAGYRLVGTVDDYYEDGSAAVRYEKRLAAPAGRHDRRAGSNDPVPAGTSARRGR